MDDIPARYQDGRTAADRAVRARPGPDGYEILDADGRILAVWRYADIGRGAFMPDGCQRLTCRAEPDACLILPRTAILPEKAARRPAGSWRTWAGLAALLAGAVVVLAGLASALPAASRIVADMVPRDLEQRWSAPMVDSMEARWHVCRDAAGQQAVDRLAARLGESLPAAQRPRRVLVADVREVNAYALPGGTIVVFRGLIAAAEGPDEVAGVLAHEMTHVALRHPLDKTIRALGVAGLVALVTGDSSGVIAGVATAAAVGAYSRQDEAAADQGALRLLGAAGIGSAGLEHFFTRMAAKETIPPWLSDHPRGSDRAAAVATGATPSRSPALSGEQWAAVKAICGNKP